MKRTLVIFACAFALTAAAEDFSCGDNSSIVTFYGNDLDCPDGLICNSKFVKVGTAKPKLCVTPATICDYSCDTKDDSKVTINGVTFICDVSKMCNSAKSSCDVCVPKPCNKEAWTCDATEDKFTMPGMPTAVSCPTGNTCNRQYTWPCSPCHEPAQPPTTTPDPNARISARSIFYRSHYA